MTQVRVAYQSERDVASWMRRNEDGQVPGRWPYGFDLLTRPGIEASWCELRNPARVVRASAQLAERLAPFRPTPVLSDSVILTWDESAAVRAIGRRGGLTHFSGVIWMTDRPGRAIGSGLQKALLGTAGLWVLSRAQLEPLRSSLGSECPPVGFVRFGIDTEFYKPTPYPERPLILSAGGDRDRDHETLYAALERVRRAVPDVEIVVQSSGTVSPPPGIRTFRSMSHVELRRLYGRMSVMVLATRHNLHVSGMTVALESMACGRPCVITDSPGMDDYVIDGEGGAVVARDPAAIADRVIELVRDGAAAQALGETGVARVRRQHSQTTMADQFAQLVTEGVA